MSPIPSPEEQEELLLSCRYGDLEDVQAFVQQYGIKVIPEIHDNSGNTVLHMACANGHIDVLDYLLPIIPPSIISVQNQSGSTALHWSALNAHLNIAQKLVQHPGGPGVDLIDIKNKAGRSPLGEAEQSGWEEGAKWFVEVMNLASDQNAGVQGETDGDATLDTDVGGSRDIEIEIEDSEGQVAKMTISGSKSEKVTTKSVSSELCS